MSAIVSTSIQIKKPGNAAGEDGNWQFRVDDEATFFKEKMKTGSWEEVDSDEF